MDRAVWWNDDLALFRNSVEGFIARELEPHRERWRREKVIEHSVWTAMGEMGMLCPAAPEAYGGSGGSFAHEAVVIDALERLAGELTAAVTVHGAIVSNYLVAFGTEEQKAKWLPELAAGELIGAIAMTEPGTGSDLRAIKARAVQDGDHYVLNGQKTFITNGEYADFIIVVANVVEEGTTGLSLLIVDRRQSEGVTSRRLDKIGMEASDTAELFFDNVRVPRENVLGGVLGLGLKQLMKQLPYERLGIAVAAAAAANKACAIATAYAKERKAFGSAIFDFQNTSFTLAQRHTEAFLARLLVDHCIGQAMKGELDGVAAAMAKMWTTDQAFATVSDCLQIHGGYGYMREYEIGRMLADTRLLKIYGGTNEMMKLIISRTL